MIPNEIIFARDKLVRIVEETFNIEATNLIFKIKGKGRKPGINNRRTYIVYLCIIWLIENKNVSRATAAKCFNRASCIASRAIKIVKELIETRDVEFDQILYDFNLALSNNHLKEVTLLQSKLNNEIMPLNKTEIYHIKFMLEHNIEIESIANHFKVNDYSISKIKDYT